jgi:hypothetical protein
MIATSLSAAQRIALPLLLLVAFALSASAAPAVVQHDLAVDLDPDRGQLKVVDRIRLPERLAGADGTIDFYLNAAFEPSLSGTAARLELLAATAQKRLRGYRVHLADDARMLTVIYTGKLTQPEGDYKFGHLGPEGVYLTETSAWYPLFEGALVAFSMQVRAPEGWTAISQGAEDSLPSDSECATQVWSEKQPQTEIVLLAGRFTTYARQTAQLDARVYLRRPDAALAERYLEATAHYVRLYGQLLGPYPYAKFALVENFWETGYGMPSLALLGPRVIRFPFILHSSFPHEILHNWWGNGVYLDHAGGNWAEGLTAYLADHLVQEQRGRGADYRRAALQKYASYVDTADDFPLSAFRGKHGEVSAAVGYNKALMFFHILRQRLGDAAFLEGLRLFAEQHWFQTADYADLRQAFESASGAELSFEFEQWVGRTGAPALHLSTVSVEEQGEGYRLKGVITQQQPGAPYRLRVPVVVQLEGRAMALRDVIAVEATRTDFELELPLRPTALHVDPEFDLFRRLGPGETPASLGDLLGAKEALFVLPASAAAGRKAVYAALADALGGGQTTADTAHLPAGKNVWLLGWSNAHLDALAGSVAADGVAFTADGVRLGSEVFRRGAACVVLAARTAHDAAHSIGFIGCDNPSAIAGLARKIPHYGKYGFLAFTGDEPVNVRKDEWPVRNSPMTIVFDPRSVRIPPPLPQRPWLAAQP